MCSTVAAVTKRCSVEAWLTSLVRWMKDVLLAKITRGRLGGPQRTSRGENFWKWEDNLDTVTQWPTSRQLVKKRRSPISSLGTVDAKSLPWFDRTAALLAVVNLRSSEVFPSCSAFVPPISVKLPACKPVSQGASSTGPAMSAD